VTEMSAYLDFRLIQGFLQAWELSRSGSKLPWRCDISLKRFSSFVSEMVIYERFGRRDFRYRQIGEQVKDRLKWKDLSVNIFSVLHPDVLESSEVWWNGLVDQRCGGIKEFVIEYANGASTHMVSVLLPVLSKVSDVPLLVGINVKISDLRRALPTAQTLVGRTGARGLFLDIGNGTPNELVEVGQFSLP